MIWNFKTNKQVTLTYLCRYWSKCLLALHYFFSGSMFRTAVLFEGNCSKVKNQVNLIFYNISWLCHVLSHFSRGSWLDCTYSLLPCLKWPFIFFFTCWQNQNMLLSNSRHYYNFQCTCCLKSPFFPIFWSTMKRSALLTSYAL